MPPENAKRFEDGLLNYSVRSGIEWLRLDQLSGLARLRTFATSTT